jgi:hypothetical protein
VHTILIHHWHQWLRCGPSNGDQHVRCCGRPDSVDSSLLDDDMAAFGGCGCRAQGARLARPLWAVMVVCWWVVEVGHTVVVVGGHFPAYSVRAWGGG